MIPKKKVSVKKVVDKKPVPTKKVPVKSVPTKKVPVKKVPVKKAVKAPNKTQVLPSKIARKIPLPVKRPKTVELFERLAKAADLEGMFATDLLKHQDLLEKHSIPDDTSREIALQADGYNRRQFKEIVKQYEYKGF